MKFSMRVSLIAAVGLSLGGCAGVDFYKDADLKTATGIPIYAPKPYLLVARTGAKDKPVEVSIVYLNDTHNVIYAKPKSGFGSSKLTLALANGQLTSFGQETDPKIAELLTSIGGLVTARAGADKTGAEADQIRAGIAATMQSATAVATGKAVADIAADIAAKDKAGALKALSAAELKTVQAAGQALAASGKLLSDPANALLATAQIASIKAQAKLLADLPAGPSSTPRDAALQLAHAWADQLNEIVSDATPEKAPEATFELYEIKQEPGGVKLVRVGA